MHKVVDRGSSESEELVRFVATARSRRPQAWSHVERLKSACRQPTGSSPELRDLLGRVWRLEHEVERLRRQARTLREQLAQKVGTVSPASAPAAANANDYADSDSA